MSGRVQSAAAQDAFEITPSDDTVIVAEALYIGTGGDVTVITRKGTAVTFVTVPTGFILPVSCIKVLATGTDAQDIVGLTY